MKGTAVYEIGTGIESEAFVLTQSLLEDGQTVDLDVPRIYIWNFNDIKITTLITSLRIINCIKRAKLITLDSQKMHTSSQTKNLRKHYAN